MPDRKAVIEQLESMRDYHRSAGNNITADIANDALELLKEQKAEYVEIVDSDHGKTHWYVCGGCKSPINPGDRYCHECGRTLKWE